MLFLTVCSIDFILLQVPIYFQNSIFVCFRLIFQGLFTHFDTVTVPVLVKVKHCINSDRHFETGTLTGIIGLLPILLIKLPITFDL